MFVEVGVHRVAAGASPQDVPVGVQVQGVQGFLGPPHHALTASYLHVCHRVKCSGLACIYVVKDSAAHAQPKDQALGAHHALLLLLLLLLLALRLTAVGHAAVGSSKTA